MSSRERSSTESRWRFTRAPPSATAISTESTPSSSASETFTRSSRAVGQVLAHVVGPDGQLAVAAVGQHRQLHPRRAAVVEQRVDGRAHRAAGVEHVVDQHHRGVVEREVDVRGVDDRLVVRAADADVVAVEGDVHVAERDGLAHQLGDQVAQADGQERRRGSGCRRPRSAHRRSARRSRARCGPGSAARPRGRALLSRSLTRPSWPLGTGLKEPRVKVTARQDERSRWCTGSPRSGSGSSIGRSRRAPPWPRTRPGPPRGRRCTG